MDWQIEGHKKQLELLGRALEKGVLAHAYVFAGPEGVGKKTIAMKLARELVESQMEFHPDLLEINSDNGIKIEQVRELIYKLSLKPYQAKNKVAIIDRADEMTIEASNALLKSLEEPKGYTYIMLITSNPNRLPKTILSRSQKITFGPIDRSEESSEEIENAKNLFEIFLTGQLSDKMIAAYEIADLETDEIKSLLDFWLKRLQQRLNTQVSKSLAQKTSQVLQARRFLDQNANTKLLLTNLMLNT